MSAILKPYTPRPGSVAERAIQHMAAFGEASATDLADALEIEASTLMPCLSTAIRFGAAEQFKRDGRVWYRLGNGTPPATEQETPPKGANRDASTGQSHGAGESASSPGRGTVGAPARGAAPAFLTPKPATSPKSHPTHGFSQTPEYRAWQQMIKRCTDPDHAAWPNYGGRGITVCERWRNDVAAFVEDMGAKPSAAHELDREDNEKGYEPSNCRWVERAENCRNRRSNRNVEWNGRRKTIAEWCEITGLAFSTLKSRLDNGWPVDRALIEGARARPDATDRETLADASPRVGAMGAGQAADAAALETEVCDHGWPIDSSCPQCAADIDKGREPDAAAVAGIEISPRLKRNWHKPKASSAAAVARTEPPVPTDVARALRAAGAPARTAKADVAAYAAAIGPDEAHQRHQAERMWWCSDGRMVIETASDFIEFQADEAQRFLALARRVGGVA